MTAIVQVPDWQERGLCQQTDPDAFFPNKGETDRRAKQVCARCEVKPECLAYALERSKLWGIWGGTSESERRQIRGLARAREARLLRESGEASC